MAATVHATQRIVLQALAARGSRCLDDIDRMVLCPRRSGSAEVGGFPHQHVQTPEKHRRVEGAASPAAHFFRPRFGGRAIRDRASQGRGLLTPLQRCLPYI